MPDPVGKPRPWVACVDQVGPFSRALSLHSLSLSLFLSFTLGPTLIFDIRSLIRPSGNLLLLKPFIRTVTTFVSADPKISTSNELALLFVGASPPPGVSRESNRGTDILKPRVSPGLPIKWFPHPPGLHSNNCRAPATLRWSSISRAAPQSPAACTRTPTITTQELSGSLDPQSCSTSRLSLLSTPSTPPTLGPLPSTARYRHLIHLRHPYLPLGHY